MGIDKLLVLTGDYILHLLDVFNGNQITWVWHTGMTVFLLVKHGQLTLLVRNEEHLVENNDLGSRYAVNE